MCKFKLFSIAAAALMMVACSTEDLTQQTQIKTGEMHFTATIASPSGTTRTTYEQDGDNINVKWVVGDEIALVHNKVKDVAKVKSISSDGTSATIEGILTGTTDELNGADVQLYYPAARISGVTSDGNPVFDGSVEGKISSQDGTPKYIQDNLDFRVGISTFSVNGSEATLKEAAKMYSQIAIWKLTLQNGSVNPVTALAASKVTIKMGSGDYTTSATATLSSPKSELTIATQIPRAIDNVRPITIEATVGNNTYVYKQDNVDVTPGKYYQSTVKMEEAWNGNLATVTKNVTATDGTTIYGTLAGNYKISIADGATVTLDGVTINGVNNESYKWAGITCDGDAIIILKGTNTVKGFYNRYPGIHPAVDHKLTIKGTGSLTASSNGAGAGIGGGWPINCGNIEIQGGTITANGGCGAGIGSGDSGSCGSITISGGTVTATGGEWGAGIGCGYGSSASCGDITISGGTVTATGGDQGVGIGGGKKAKCGDITITTGVTQVTATKGDGATNSIGAGNDGSCGTVTIGGVVGAISTSPYTYPAPALNLTSPAVGQVIGDDGKNYEYGSVPSGVKAVAKICYVSGTTGLALALKDDANDAMKWVDANSIAVAHQPVFSNGTWRLPNSMEWQAMKNASGGSVSLRNGFEDVGGTNMAYASYWGASLNDTNATYIDLYSSAGSIGDVSKDSNCRVRAVLVF